MSPTLCPVEILRRFPPTFIQTGELDPLLDDSIDFVHKLRRIRTVDAEVCFLFFGFLFFWFCLGWVVFVFFLSFLVSFADFFFFFFQITVISFKLSPDIHFGSKKVSFFFFPFLSSLKFLFLIVFFSLVCPYGCCSKEWQVPYFLETLYPFLNFLKNTLYQIINNNNTGILEQHTPGKTTLLPIGVRLLELKIGLMEKKLL